LGTQRRREHGGNITSVLPGTEILDFHQGNVPFVCQFSTTPSRSAKCVARSSAENNRVGGTKTRLSRKSQKETGSCANKIRSETERKGEATRNHSGGTRRFYLRTRYTSSIDLHCQ
jgi:hypothetical protein